MKIFEQYKGLRRELYVLFACELIDNAGSMVGPMLTLILSTKMGMGAEDIAIYFLIYTLLSLPIHLLGGRLTDKIKQEAAHQHMRHLHLRYIRGVRNNRT